MSGFRVSFAHAVLAPALALCTACPAEDGGGADTAGTSSPQTMSGTPTTGEDDGASSTPDPSDPSDPSNPSDPSDPTDPSATGPGDTGVAGADCCTAHTGSGCDDATIQACVCEDDAVCCTFDWDALCVNAARNRCGACGGSADDDSGSSGGEPGTDGGSESGDTGPGMTTVDPTAGGEACCDTTQTPGCPSDAALEECVCALDDYCCMMEWDSLCVEQAVDDCMADCTFGTGCCEIHPSTGCDNAPVEACVCAVDPFCCDEQWDQQCVGEVESEQCGNC